MKSHCCVCCVILWSLKWGQNATPFLFIFSVKPAVSWITWRDAQLVSMLLSMSHTAVGMGCCHLHSSLYDSTAHNRNIEQGRGGGAGGGEGRSTPTPFHLCENLISSLKWALVLSPSVLPAMMISPLALVLHKASVCSPEFLKAPQTWSNLKTFVLEGTSDTITYHLATFHGKGCH